MTHLSNSHNFWKGKIIKLKLSSGFGVSLEWRLADGSQNRFLEATKAKAMIFSKVRKLSFSGHLVKDESVVRKHWHQPLVTDRVGEGSYTNHAT